MSEHFISREDARGDLLSCAAYLAEEIGGSDDRAEAIAAVIPHYLAKGEVDLAAELSNSVDDPFVRDRLLIAVAAKCAELDDDEYALQLAEAIEEYGLQSQAREAIALTKAEKGDLAGACAVADSVIHPDHALGGIAVKQAERGDEAAALETISEIDYPGSAAIALLAITSMKVEKGENEKAVEYLETARSLALEIEHDEEKIHPVSFELIGKARELAQVINHPVYAVLICRDADLFAPEILSYGVDRIFVYEEERLAHFNVERYTNCMADFIEKIKPSVVLYGGTATGRSFAPRVASRFRTGLTADCTILGMKKNTDLIQNRPAFGGNIMASIICPNTRPQMATVRYKIFKMPEKEAPHGTIQKMELSFDLSSRLELLEVKAKDAIVDISEAEVLVAVGRAFKTKEDLALAQKLADLLGGQVATTRPLIEAGLMDAKKQIGLSGRTVAPKLLITLGVSGAVQFTAGMSGSETVFSVNLDKNAPTLLRSSGLTFSLSTFSRTSFITPLSIPNFFTSFGSSVV